MQRGAEVSYSDSHVPSIQVDGVELVSRRINGQIETSDCVAILTDHSSVDYENVLRKAKLVVDTRNALRRITSEKLGRL